MALEQEILASAEELVARGAKMHDLCGQTFAWLQAYDRADAVFDIATKAALAEPREDRAFRAGSLAGTIYSCGLMTRGRALAEVVGKMPFDTGTTDERTRTAVEIADAFISVGLNDRALAPLEAAHALVTGSTQAMRWFLVGLVLDQMSKIRHPRTAELLDFARANNENLDAFAHGNYGRYECRIGQVDAAWKRAELLLDEGISLAVLLSDIMNASPTEDVRLRDLIGRVEDPIERGTLLISAARGVSRSPDLVGAALDLIEEGLARTSAAPPSTRWDSVLYAAEILNDLGEHNRAARLARESLEMLPQSPADELPRRTASTGRALARAGERAAAFRLYRESIGTKAEWYPAIFLRDIAFSFPKPPDR